MNVQFGDGKMSGEADGAEIEGQLGDLIRAQGGFQDVSKKNCVLPRVAASMCFHMRFLSETMWNRHKGGTSR